MSEEVAQVLDRARQIIVERGWWQGRDYGPNGEVCAAAAIQEAYLDDYLVFVRACRALMRVTHSGNIPAWNDPAERTRRQVLLAFRRAAKAERAKP